MINRKKIFKKTEKREPIYTINMVAIILLGLLGIIAGWGGYNETKQTLEGTNIERNVAVSEKLPPDDQTMPALEGDYQLSKTEDLGITFLNNDTNIKETSEEDMLSFPKLGSDLRNNDLSYFRKMSDEDWAKMDSIISSVIKPGMNRVEQVKAIHDWMVMNLQYDTTYTQHNASSSLNDQLAVCSGYSALFANFMDVIGVPNAEVWGTAVNSEGQRGGHAWNVVQIGDYYYAVDVCWDDPLIYGHSNYRDGYNLSYEYFLVSLDTISLNHFSNDYPSPMARENLNWQDYIGKGEDNNPAPQPDPTPEPTMESDPEPEPIPLPIPEPEPTPAPDSNPDIDKTPTPKPQAICDPAMGIQVEANEDSGSGEFSQGIVGEEGIILSENDPSFMRREQEENMEKVDVYINDEYIGYYYEMQDGSVVNGPFQMPDDL